jgi:primosomal protein N' (replication factor Y) (superfamily II helicase)
MMARVVIVGAVGTLDSLTYAVPASLAEQLTVGHRVLVPLRSRRVTAIVTEIGDNLDSGGSALKPIVELLEARPLFDPAHLQLVQFLASYYMAPSGEAFRNVLPALARVESRRIFRLVRFPSLLAQIAFSALERAIVEELAKRPVTLRQLARLGESGVVKAAVGRLMNDGWITWRDATRGRHREPNPGNAGTDKNQQQGPRKLLHSVDQAFSEKVPASNLELSSEQAAAITAITPAIRRRQFEPFLLWGVTASGKTEVYIRLAAEALQEQQQVLVLVPEIALADQLVSAFQAHFGSLVGVAHSAQNVGERWASWMAALNGDAKIMIGPRSAIFTPISGLGLIVVDEEHDGAYKQEEGIRYNARDLAVVLARLASCPVVLGSATPSAESYANARRNRYHILQMTQRIQQRAFARVDIIDLRQNRAAQAKPQPNSFVVQEPALAGRGVAANGSSETPVSLSSSPGNLGQNDSALEGVNAASTADQVPLSPGLIDALGENLATGGQTLVFLNRRGYHNFLQCHLCGTVVTCTNCSVSMTFHLRGRMLRCHYCGASEPAPGRCFECGGFGLEGQGYGTERLVHALAHLFPSARIQRMDSDTSGRRGARSAIVQSVHSGEIDILVGTQMITKGLDFRNVTLVAVVLADLSLNMPDFRSAERTFQLLTQAAGRAGRGERPGRVVIQTYSPYHYSIRAASEQDYARFIRREMELRRELMYPPFAQMALVRIEGAEPSSVSQQASKIAGWLAKSANPESTRVLGPAPAPIERIKQRYRWQVLIKARRRDELRAALASVTSYRSEGGVRVSVDIDPINML